MILGMVRLRAPKRLSRETVLRIHRDVDGWAADGLAHGKLKIWRPRSEAHGETHPGKRFSTISPEKFLTGRGKRCRNFS